MNEQITETENELDVPRLPRQGNYRDPNEPLSLDGDALLQLTANHFVSERTLILGQTGMGKGNAGALITEFLLEAGLPLTFIDLEGEGYSFKEICSSLLVVGRSSNADREYSPSQMGRLAELSVEQGFSVVLDLSGYTDEEIFALVSPYLRSLWATCERLRTPYHLIVDEAHELVPEEGTTPVKSLLRRIAKRGRKRGLGVVAMSQETASLDKKFLRQMDIRILLPVTYEADLKIYHTLIPGISLDTLRNTMPAFPPGTGYVVFKHQPYLVHLLRRRTFDPSETPKLGDQRSAPVLHTMDQRTLEIIDQSLPTTHASLEGLDRATLIQLVRDLRRDLDGSQDNDALVSDPSLSDPAQSKQSLNQYQEDRRRKTSMLLSRQAQGEQDDSVLTYPDVEALLAEKNAEIRTLQEQLDVLGKVKVSLDGALVSVADIPSFHVETLTTQVDHASLVIERVQGELSHLKNSSEREGEGYPVLQEEEQRMRAEYQEAQRILQKQARELQRLRKEQKQHLASNQPQDVVESFSYEQLTIWRMLMHALITLKETPRAIVRVLLLYDGRSLTASEIAGKIRKASSTTTSNIPYVLADLGLLEVHKRRNAMVYTAHIQVYLHKHFPGKEKAVLSHLVAIL